MLWAIKRDVSKNRSLEGDKKRDDVRAGRK
jgi:hypothetical protein